ncbi:ATP-binding protein [Carbonactinospora thermoautotrophica]|uniref:ATP-binding protein n=1 Tax=Carbonactinospora thermoautotrophica TaxID=1469144 RepID=UPI003DA9B440
MAVNCRRCREAPAVIDIPHHQLSLCAPCFLKHCRDQVQRTIDAHKMLEPGERCLVAVSGGKDSLAVWDILLDLGYPADGVYLGLGIGEYSDASAERARGFAAKRGVRLIEVDLATELGFTIPEARGAGRSSCSACGLSKRHLLNRVALENGYRVLVTGHNLDDEVAVLFGNVMRWDLPYLARQYPTLPEREGFARRVKPLVRLSERETAAYCVIRGIDYIIDECPMAVGNKHLMYKELINALEEKQPGAKYHFFLGFLDRVHPRLEDVGEEDRAGLRPCVRCGSPTIAEVCAFCRLADRSRNKKARRRKRQRVAEEEAPGVPAGPGPSHPEPAGGSRAPHR